MKNHTKHPFIIFAALLCCGAKDTMSMRSIVYSPPAQLFRGFGSPALRLLWIAEEMGLIDSSTMDMLSDYGIDKVLQSLMALYMLQPIAYHLTDAELEALIANSDSIGIERAATYQREIDMRKKSFYSSEKIIHRIPPQLKPSWMIQQAKGLGQKALAVPGAAWGGIKTIPSHLGY